VLFGGGAPGVIDKSKPVPVSKEITAVRHIKALALGQGDSRRAEAFAKEMYPHDELLMKGFEADTKALSASILSEGGSTVPEVLSDELILPLYTTIGATSLGARRIPLVNGNITIPRINTAGTTNWVGENAAITKTQQVTGDIKLNSKKLACLVPISNDLLKSSRMSADQWVLDDLRAQMGVEMDRSMLYGSGSVNQPAGLTKLLPSGQILGSTSTAFTSTLLTQLYGTLAQANVKMLKPGILMNATAEAYLMNLRTSTGAFLFFAEMMERKTIRGIPYAVSNNCTFTDTGTYATSSVQFFIGDWSEFIIGEQSPLEVEMSREATYIVGGTPVSAYQNDQTLIRVLSRLDYNIRHTASFIAYTAKLAES